MDAGQPLFLIKCEISGCVHGRPFAERWTIFGVHGRFFRSVNIGSKAGVGHYSKIVACVETYYHLRMINILSSRQEMY